MLFVFTIVGVAATARADTHLLTFGGGSDPQHTQLSLQQNVLYLQQVLSDLGLAKLPHDIYFADAGSSQHTVQVQTRIPPDQEFPEQLAEIFNSEAALNIRFQPVNIPHLAGPSNLKSLSDWFRTTGKTLTAKDHLLLYYTGHGGPASANPKETPRNTTLSLWDSPDLSVKEFEMLLDQLDPAVDVTLLMVQCHAGGFANLLYKDADPAKGYSKHLRCGFFATTAQRMAAGCTADIDEDDYEEFSTTLLAALDGKSRTGKIVQTPDYDHDGIISYTEAFTYVLLTSDTIDTPMTTSDQLLRDKSRFRTARDTDISLLGQNADYATILKLATPAQKAALDGLSAELQLTGDDCIGNARSLAKKLEDDRRALERPNRRITRDYDAAREKLRAAISAHWPELDIPWNPDTPKLVATEGPAIKAFVISLPAWQDLLAVEKRRNNHDDQDSVAERKWAKVQRFLARAETVILAANLPKLADKETLDTYNALIARENRTLKEAP